METRLRRFARPGLLLVTTALLPLLVRCQVDAVATPPTAYATVQVATPPPPDVNVTATTDAQPADPNAEVADTDPSALADFHSALDPYGQWVDDPQYGTLWYPNPQVVGGDFTPYMTSGHWVYDSDYTWVSDYDWGWAPFHYGRWMSTPRGWGWVPGHEYAGAWVTWRNGDDGYGYAGWAPTPPSYYWRGGAAVNFTTPIQPRFVYVQTTDLFQPNIGVRVLPRNRWAEVEGRTRVYAPVPREGGGRVVVRGPAPTRFGINTNAIARPPANNPGLARAQQFRTVRPATNVRPVTNPPPGGVRPTERPGDFHGSPPGGQTPPGGVRPTERPGDFHGSPPPGQQPGHVQQTDPRPDLQGHAAGQPQHPVTPQPPPDARTRPVTPTPQQMHAAPPPTVQHPVTPPVQRRDNKR